MYIKAGFKFAFPKVRLVLNKSITDCKWWCLKSSCVLEIKNTKKSETKRKKK